MRSSIYASGLRVPTENDCLTDLPDVQRRVGELKLGASLCSQPKVIALNNGTIEHWNDLVDREDDGDTPAECVYGSPSPFMRAQPFR